MTLEERVKRLERDARRWRSAAAVLAMLVVTIFFGAKDASDGKVALFDVVKCRELNVVDANGETCAFVTGRSDIPGLVMGRGFGLYNDKHEVAASWSADRLTMFNGDKRTVELSADGWVRCSGVGVLDKDGKGVGGLSYDRERDRGILLLGREGGKGRLEAWADGKEALLRASSASAAVSLFSIGPSSIAIVATDQRSSILTDRGLVSDVPAEEMRKYIEKFQTHQGATTGASR